MDAALGTAEGGGPIAPETESKDRAEGTCGDGAHNAHDGDIPVSFRTS